MITRISSFFHHPVLFLGLDLGKSKSQLAVLASDGTELLNFAFVSSRENFIEIARLLRPSDSIVLEVSTSANAVMTIFRTESAAKAVLSNPLFTRAISKARVKSDREDARKLADLHRAGYLQTVWFPDTDTIALRKLMSDRDSLVNLRTKLKNRVHSVLDRNLVKHSFSDLFSSEGRRWLASLSDADILPVDERDRISDILASLDHAADLVDQTDRAIAAFITSRPAIRRDLDILLTIPGVSLAVGAAVLAATGDISRFPTKQKFACYFGLTQRISQSGGKQPRIGRISKQGNAYARFMLVEAAEHFRKASPVYARLFDRIKKKRGRNVAIIAIARRLAEVIWSILSRGEEFVFSHPRLAAEKRRRVDQFAGIASGANLPRAIPPSGVRETNLRGRDVKREIFKRSCAEVARILESSGRKTTTAFNPRNPKHID